MGENGTREGLLEIGGTVLETALKLAEDTGVSMEQSLMAVQTAALLSIGGMLYRPD